MWIPRIEERFGEMINNMIVKAKTGRDIYIYGIQFITYKFNSEKIIVVKSSLQINKNYGNTI